MRCLSSVPVSCSGRRQGPHEYAVENYWIRGSWWGRGDRALANLDGVILRVGTKPSNLEIAIKPKRGSEVGTGGVCNSTERNQKRKS